MPACRSSSPRRRSGRGCSPAARRRSRARTRTRPRRPPANERTRNSDSSSTGMRVRAPSARRTAPAPATAERANAPQHPRDPQPHDGRLDDRPATPAPRPRPAARCPARPGTAPRSGSRVSRSSRRAGTSAAAPSDEVDEEHQPPARPLDQQAAERRAGRRGDAADRAPQRRRRGPPLERELRQQQPQRRRHEQRRARRLQHARADQHPDRRREPAQRRGHHEQRQPREEQPPPPQQVRQPSRRHQQRGEDDVVRVQHPRQPGQRTRPETRARIDGNATLTIVTSRKAMNTATAVTSRTFQRRSSCFMQRTLHRRVASRYSPREMLGRTYEGQNCSVAKTLELVGERWTVLILREVFFGRRRFDEMADDLGIARNVLTARLQRLVEEGVLEQGRLPGAPRALRVPADREGPGPVARARHADAVRRPLLRARRPADRDHPQDCGGTMDAAPHLQRCGEKLTAKDVRAQKGPGATPEAPAPASALARTGRP